MPATGVLIVDHGSLRPGAHESLVALAHEVELRMPGEVRVAIAHLSSRGPTIAEGVAELVQAGVARIVVHPHFLAPGAHASEDVPAQVAAALGASGLERIVLDPWGADPALAALLAARVLAALD